MTTEAQRQFGQQAAHYSVSASHASGDSLAALVELAQARPGERALDIGTGAGFTACALAPQVERVLATDIAAPMLQETRHLAQERGLINVLLALAAAERLPLADASFHLTTCRVAAHHFLDVPTAVREMARVTAHGGSVVLCDTVAPEDPHVAAWMNQVEARRDPSHQRDLSLSEWEVVLSQAGLLMEAVVLTKTNLEFFDWVRRAGTPAQEVARLEQDFRRAAPVVKACFGISPDGEGIRFAWDCAVLRCQKL